MKRFILSLAALSLLSTPLAAIHAQEIGEVLDLLVDKKLITPADSERVKAASAKAYADTSAGKLNLSNSITELKLYGDGRLRYQYDQFDQQLDTPKNPTANNVNQRSRWRFRLRLGADIKLGSQFFGGVGLTTGLASDSTMQTFTGGFDNYNIYINKVFLGWKPTNWLTLIAGKQENPLYTTDLVWDPDITPQGLTEIVDIGKALFPDSPLQLQLIAAQNVFFDNNEWNVNHDAATDAYQFVAQIKATYNFDKDTSVTVAPGFLTYTAASLSGLNNSLAFSKPQDIYPAPPSLQTQTTNQAQNAVQIKYDKNGVPSVTVTPVDVQTVTQATSPASGSPRTVISSGTRYQQSYSASANSSGNVVADPAHGVPAVAKNAKLANQTITTTQITSSGSVVVTTPTGVGPTGETRDLQILTAPGDFSFKLGNVKTKLYWDFAYNLNGAKRFNDIYDLTGHTTRDDISWLVGLQFGSNKKAGDWSLFTNYREVGISSIDPNLNDSDFAGGALNVRGIKAGGAYNFTDWLSASLAYYRVWNLNSNLIGGQATGGAGLANVNSFDEIQVDLNWKF